MKYRYCQVIPYGLEKSYWYLCEKGIERDDYVLVPAGVENQLCKGMVRFVKEFEEDEVPFPLERMKKIAKKITESEYFDNTIDATALKPKPDPNEAIKEFDTYIYNGEYDNVFRWACRHHYDAITDETMCDYVIRAYLEAGTHGIGGAYANLGTMYYSGTGVEANPKKALTYYRKAADLGDMHSLSNLGYCYYYGQLGKVDYKKAYEYFHLAALMGDNAALYKVGDMYRDSRYVEVNLGVAFKLYSKAYENEVQRKANDYETNLPDIEMRLAEMYLVGSGCEVDTVKAFKYITHALNGFYARRKTDPYADELISRAQMLMQEIQEQLDEEFKAEKNK